MSKAGSKTNVSMNKGGLYETETQRLQKDADNFTKQLEGQKRNEMKMKADLAKESKALKEMRDRVKEKRPATMDQNKFAIIKRLENQLDKEMVQYNQTVAENKKLQKEIDKYRKDKKASDEILAKLIKQKQNLENATTKTTQKRNKERAAIEDATMTTVLIKSTYGKKKEEYNENISRLKNRLQEKIEDQKEDERNRGKDLEKLDKELANPVDVIAQRLENWKTRVKHKKETLDMFIKHIGIIRDAFGQIKKATGISNIQEIVVSFIKSQEQTDALNSHLNILDQEIDSLEDQKSSIRKEIKSKDSAIQYYNTSNSSIAESIKMRRNDLSKSTKAKSGELERVKRIINAIQDPVSEMIKKFKQSSIKMSVAEDKIYDETTTFNEQNLNEYLAEVEEYIKCLLTLMGMKFGFEHPMLAALGLDELPSKIEAPTIPRDVLVEEEEEEEEPDDDTLNDMLDKTKYEKMISDIMVKRNDASRSMIKAEEDEKEEAKKNAVEKPKSSEKKREVEKKVVEEPKKTEEKPVQANVIPPPVEIKDKEPVPEGINKKQIKTAMDTT